MKILLLKRSFLMIAAAGLGVSALSVGAQDATSTAPAAAPAISQPAATPVTLSYGADQVLQLARAKVNDGTIIAYIQNSSGGFTLSADQIIYLKQQGISDAILNAMLTQPKNGPASQAAAPAPAQVTEAPATTTVYVPSATSYYYYPPYYRYYPYSYDSGWCYPAVSFSFGYRGSWGGGWHGGGGFHDGGFHGGGFHGGGGGFHGGHR